MVLLKLSLRQFKKCYCASHYKLPVTIMKFAVNVNDKGLRSQSKLENTWVEKRMLQHIIESLHYVVRGAVLPKLLT